MTNVTLYGPNWSAYTRTVRLVLAEKEIEYDLKEVDFSDGVMPAEHLNLHPFGKVPVLTHGNHTIYETGSVCRYIDEAFTGLVLQPSNAKRLGRMAQIISILDTYLSNEIRMGFVNELLFKPKIGLVPDQDRVKNARQKILYAFSAISDLIETGGFLVDQKITLADLHAAPLFDYLNKTPGGEELINSQRRLKNWWLTIESRSSMVNTEPDLTPFEQPDVACRIRTD